jgi:inorganic pyrophosphatase
MIRVKVIIDRPIYSEHPEHKGLIYQLNYGYVEGIIAPDGEEQDCYIMDVDVPIKEYEGNVIAVIKRLDDIEEKWVVSNGDFTIDEIREKTHFQEQYFTIEINKLEVDLNEI